MNVKCIATAALLMGSSLFAQQPGQIKILWDGTKAETCGTTADWCIDADLHNLNWNPDATAGSGGSYDHSNPQQYPTPTQTAITSSTAETYWEGALSYWAIDCVNRGYWVESLPPLTGQITYGSNTNTQDLSKYNVFVVDEPNIRFTQAEITAMMQFIENGGSLFAISDHNGSDRNNDGWDSPAIWNDFMTNNPVLNNAFGYTFALESFSGTTSNLITATTDSITRGPYGNVAEVQWSSGTCMTINTSQNSSVKAHIWKTSAGQADTAALCVTARWKCGKIASISDSSPPDDGTGNPNSTLYTGYTGDASGNHRPWLMNMMIWLAEGGNCTQTMGVNSVEESNTISIYPNPNNGSFVIEPGNNSKQTMQVYDVNGKLVLSQTINGKTSIDASSFNEGVYNLSLQSNEGVVNKRLIIVR